MSIQLPPMNHLTKRWNLPQEFIEKADYYRLERISKEEALNLYQCLTSDPGVEVCKDGIYFTPIFLKDPEAYPLVTSYWASYRSLTFDFMGKKTTKSFVLLQPAFNKAEPAPRKFYRVKVIQRVKTKGFPSFAELSFPKEPDGV